MTFTTSQGLEPLNKRQLRSAVFWAPYAAVAFCALFLVPFHFPPSKRLVSASYSFGFNNQVAILAATILIGVAALYRIRYANSPSRLRFSPDKQPRVSSALLVSALLAYLIFTLAIYLWARSSDWYGMDWETSHFLWRLKLTETYGLHPYSGYQYEYGPLLAYLPIWFHRALRPFGVSDELSYYLLHWVLDAAGLCSIAFILNRLSMPAMRRNVIFAAIAAAAFLPYMGLSGVIIRFTAPLFGLVLLYRIANSSGVLFLRAFLGTVAAAALSLGLSAEIGVGFFIAAAAYGVFLLPRRVGVAVLSALIAVLALSPAVVPSSYYESLFHFSQGANNLPLLPTSPHLVMYLVAMLWFVPQWLSQSWKDTKDRALIVAVSCLSIVLMPGALGRCDPPHVLTYGLTPALLVFACIANSEKVRFRAAIAMYAVVFVVGFQIINAWVFHVTPASILATLRTPRGNPSDFDWLAKYETIALPFGSSGSSKSLQNWLWSHRKLAPEYYLGAMGIYTDTQISDRLRDLSRFRYALTLDNIRALVADAGPPCAGSQRYIRKAMVHPWTLACKHQEIDPSIDIARFLDRNYRVIQRQGEYLVWERSN